MYDGYCLYRDYHPGYTAKYLYLISIVHAAHTPKPTWRLCQSWQYISARGVSVRIGADHVYGCTSIT